jgi:hypothetical protein
VLRTRVPEAAVEEYGYALAGKDDVGMTPYSLQRSSMNAIAKTEPVEG